MHRRILKKEEISTKTWDEKAFSVFEVKNRPVRQEDSGKDKNGKQGS